MDKRIEILIECILYDKIKIFAECEEDEIYSKKLIKDEILEFCEEYDVSIYEVIDKLKDMFNDKDREKREPFE